MNKTREIQNFFYGQYFADGVRISLGTLIPAFLFYIFDNLQVGSVVSLGALMVGLADTPGPASYRRNGMFFCLALTIITSLFINLANAHTWLLLLSISFLSFAFSMLSVYGARAATVGAMGMLAMILHTDNLDGNLLHILEHLLYLLVGGAWYIIMSVVVTQARPYRLAQQELSESIHKVAEYIRIKSKFYAKEINNDENFIQLIDQQVLVHEHMESVREILFRSKRIIRDTTRTGKVLILVFTDIIDLFEQSMATHYDYNAISEKFGHSRAMKEFERTIIRIANELDNLAFEINANRIPKALYNLREDLERIKTAIDEVEQTEQLNTLPLKKILINVRNLTQRIEHIYNYFTLENSTTFRGEEADYTAFVDKQRFDFKILKNNLTLRSSTFRHSLRMGIVMGLGYLVSLNLNVGAHNYWVLLTIMVILKPGFGLTKQRNFQRVIGTIIGGIGGAIIILLVQDELILFILLLLLMIATYSLIRINYIVAVMFMTPYVLIMFSFFEVNTLLIMQERILDTAIGSTMAFLSSYVIFPNWESNHLNHPMRKMLIANYRYIGMALQIIAGKSPSVTEFKLARKEVYIATANMGSAFQRLITEPKSRQKDAKRINKFVVLNHIFSSFAVTVLNLVRQADNSALTGEQVKLIRRTLYLLAQSIKAIEPDPDDPNDDFKEIEVNIPGDLDANNLDSEEQRLITEQLQFIQRIASDLYRVIEQGKQAEKLTE